MITFPICILQSTRFMISSSLCPSHDISSGKCAVTQQQSGMSSCGSTIRPLPFMNTLAWSLESGVILRGSREVRCFYFFLFVFFFSSIGWLVVKEIALCGLWEKREGTEAFYTLNTETVSSIPWPFLVFDSQRLCLFFVILQPYEYNTVFWVSNLIHLISFILFHYSTMKLV